MLKRLIAVIIPLFVGLEVFSQVPCQDLTLSDITFVRQNFKRNFYSDGIVTSELNLNGTDLFLDCADNLIVSEGTELHQESDALVFDSAGRVRIAAFHPYYCYEAVFEGNGGIVFYANDGSDEIKVSGPKKLRVQYTGKRYHVFDLDGTEWKLLRSESRDMRRSDTPMKWSWGVYGEAGTRIKLARSLLSSGTGQADPQVVQNSDGTPYIKDGRLYVCLTTRGFKQIPDSYQGVYSLGLTGFDLRLEGALFFCDGPDDVMLRPYHATKIVRDNDRWLVITTTHGGVHDLAWAESDVDLMHGVHLLECHDLDYPHNNDGTSEDPDIFFDSQAGLWRLGYCARVGDNNGNILSYRTFLCESKNWNGPYKNIARNDQDNCTGIRIAKVGGHRYVLSGGTGSDLHVFNYPTLETVGKLNIEFAPGGSRAWPTIVPIPYGNYERYLLITFDHGHITGNFSYGTLHYFLGDKMWKKTGVAEKMNE